MRWDTNANREFIEESKTVSNALQAATCQQCGVGFIVTSTYHDLLARRQVSVIVPVSCPTCFLTKGPLPKQRGEVKWFNPDKHYGFIITETGAEIFVHQEQLLEASRAGLRDGQRVRFHMRYTVKGPEALNVESMEE